jgi:CPA2 family monovalent cation:H+ antiporter-2
LESNPLLFRDLTYIFLAALCGGSVAWRLRLPLILGFVLGGLVISPFTPGPHLSSVHTFEVFAEVGVVLLMFSIGFEFSLRDLLRVKWVALLGAPLGILAVIGLAMAAGRIPGWTVPQALVIGAAVSVASTMVLARLLSSSGRLTQTYSRVMIGITLVEDLAVICMTVLMPILAGPGDGKLLRAAWILGKALLLLAPLTFAAIKVIPRVLRKVKATCDTELFLLAAIAVCLGTAALAEAAGFSVALGAFLAGFALSGLDDLHDAYTQLVPLRDAFVALFFVSLGTLIEPRTLLHNLSFLAWMLALIVLGKFLVWSAVVRIFRYSLRTAIVVAAGLTQIGELSFVLVQVARTSGLVTDEIFSAIIAASLLSISLNVFLVRAAFRWQARLAVLSPETLPATMRTPPRGRTAAQLGGEG